MRLIDGDALLAKLKQPTVEDINEVLRVEYDNAPNDVLAAEAIHNMYETVREAIKGAPTLESPRDWMPCAEGLPTPRYKGQQRQAYLVSLETGCVSMMFYEFNPNGYLGDGWTDKIISVIAWCELPDPYNPDHIREAGKEDKA